MLITASMIQVASAQSWNLTGNAGTTGSNFIGTTDNVSLKFKTKNINRMTISSVGSVGIGTTTPGAKLDVTGNSYLTGHFTNTATGVDNVGVVGGCNNTPGYGWGVWGSGGSTGVRGESRLAGLGNRVGVNGVALDGSGYNRGVSGFASGGSVAYGVFGYAQSATTSTYAGYFEGNVYAVAYYQSSDRKLKNDIQPLSGALSIIQKLKPSVYTFKTNEYQQMQLPAGLQYGLIADEVQQVIPGAVKKAVHPAMYENDDEHNGKKLSEEVEFNAVNYIEMIPILISGIKEQQAMIEKLTAKVAVLEGSDMSNGSAKVAVNAAANTPLLGQNIPNPFENNTIIPFRIPQNCNSASIIISEAGTGKIVKTIPVSCNETQIAIDAGTLSIGSYSYSLFINGELVDSKQMILVK